MSKTDAMIVVALARSNMNYMETARRTHYTKSTVMYHLDKVERKTGLNPRNFFDLHELYSIACNILGDEADEI